MSIVLNILVFLLSSELVKSRIPTVLREDGFYRGVIMVIEGCLLVMVLKGTALGLGMRDALS